MRRYAYVGPEHVRAAAAHAEPGTEIRSRAELERWLDAHVAEREGAVIPATFVVSEDGVLRIASRRSEHVACAAGLRVLAAGEMFFERRPVARAVAISNLSTGYCPEPACWSAVASALAAAGVEHPGRLTSAFVFRRCPACGERNVIKDDHFVCAVCDAELPASWNFDGEP